MNRRAFIAAAGVALAAPALPAIAAPDLEITRPDPDAPIEILRRHDLLRFPWQIRIVRWHNGREFDFVALTEHYPDAQDIATVRQYADAAFARLKAWAA